MRLLISSMLVLIGCQAPAATPASVAPPASLGPTAISCGGRDVAPPAFRETLARADAICIGEQHDQPAHHRFQAEVVQVLAEADRPLAVGFEMVARPRQPILDRFQAGEVAISALEGELDWSDTWGFGWAMYEPIFAEAKTAGADLLALNAPKEQTRGLSRGTMSDDEVQRLQIDLTRPGHRRFFWAAMGLGEPPPGPQSFAEARARGPKKDDEGASEAGPHGSMNIELMYAAQVLWDETMGKTAASWLEDHAGGQVLIIAGNGHCHDDGIVARMERRIDSLEALTVLSQNDGTELMPKTTSDCVAAFPAPASDKAGAENGDGA